MASVQSLGPTLWKEETDSCKVSFDRYMHTMAHMLLLQIQTNKCNLKFENGKQGAQMKNWAAVTNSHESPLGTENQIQVLGSCQFF